MGKARLTGSFGHAVVREKYGDRADGGEEDEGPVALSGDEEGGSSLRVEEVHRPMKCHHERNTMRSDACREDL